MTPLAHIYGEAHVAVAYGMEEAVFLDAVMFWYRTNRGNARPVHFHDGRWWTYNSVKAFEDVFPWWNAGQLRRIITRCREKGALLVGNYNKDQRDRTAWYSPSDALLALYGEDSGACSSRNRQMEGPEPSAVCAGTGEALPRNTHERSDPPYSPPAGDGPAEPAAGDKPAPRPRRPRVKKSVPAHAPERFEQFWAAYPVGGSRLKAVEAWDALAPDDGLIDEMARALKRQMASRPWQEGIGIPHACRWLSNQRWTDKLPEGAPAQGGQGGWADDPEAEG